jgi:glycerol kinase
MLDKPVEVPPNAETTAHGAAYLAGLKAGVYKNLADIERTWQVAKRYDPHMDPQTRNSLYEGWKDALKRVL